MTCGTDQRTEVRFASFLSGGFITAPFAFCVITFEPIEVHTCSAPQNDWLNFCFEKDILQMAKIGYKWSKIVYLHLFIVISTPKSKKQNAPLCTGSLAPADFSCAIFIQTNFQ